MKELGATSKEYHRLVARQLLDNHVNYAFLAGPEMKYAYDILKTDSEIKVFYGETPAPWIKELAQLARQGGTCLIKASRSMNFENIFKEI